MDAGWLKTINELIPTLTNIFDSVVETLSANNRAKYTQGDIYLFSLWYDEISEVKKDKVKQLVEAG